MPERLRAAYEEMRPRIEAERELGMFTSLLAAAGRMLPDDIQQQHVAQLRAAAEGPRGQQQRPPKITPAFFRDLQAAAERAGGRAHPAG